MSIDARIKNETLTDWVRRKMKPRVWVYKKNKTWHWECSECLAGWEYERWTWALKDAVRHSNRHYIVGFRKSA